MFLVEEVLLLWVEGRGERIVPPQWLHRFLWAHLQGGMIWVLRWGGS